MSKSTPLSDLLNARRPPDMSGRELGRKAGIGESTGTAYLNGRHPKRPSRDVLERIAEVLPVTVREMQIAAGMPPDVRTWDPPEEVHSLSIEMQDEITRFIRLIAHEREGGSSASTGEPEKKTPPGEPGARGSGPGTVAELPPRTPEEPDLPDLADLAADHQGGPSAYEQIVAEQDRAGEEGEIDD